jgi:hypothetical protein
MTDDQTKVLSLKTAYVFGSVDESTLRRFADAEIAAGTHAVTDGHARRLSHAQPRRQNR